MGENGAIKFWSLVDIRSRHECWPWIGSKRGRKDDPYGCLTWNGRSTGAHRVALTLIGRPPKPEEHVDHLCRNRICVNPSHLEAVTPKENVLRGIGPSANNARKTHCDQGHVLEGRNLLRRPNGWRECRRCARASDERLRDVRKPDRARRSKVPEIAASDMASIGMLAEQRRMPPGKRTHCSKGHPYSAENTIIRRGARECRVCKSMMTAKWQRQKPASPTPFAMERE